MNSVTDRAVFCVAVTRVMVDPMCSSTQECSQLHLGWRTPWAKDRSVAPSETGRIPPQPIEATALTMLGAMREVALYVARARSRPGTPRSRRRHEDIDPSVRPAGIVGRRGNRGW